MRVLVIGAGVGGLTTAALLAQDGHDVTVLERDASPPPAEPADAWTDWQRTGVNQFRMLHFFNQRFRSIAATELPSLLERAESLGALRINPLAAAPEELHGGLRPEDERFTAVTARRPVMEMALASTAVSAGADVRRGVAVAGLLTDDGAGSAPHVVGVRTEDGDDLRADVVVDATGRRSPLPSWLGAIGARPPAEELDDAGFVYYGRYFRSADGSLPPALGGYLQHYGSVSILTLPADNGTWGVGVIAVAGDAPLRRARDRERWTALVRSFPLVAHWVDGEPLDDDVAVMAKIEDRHRRFVVDGEPVATGVLAVADSWACTNPSVGRGAAIGLVHAVALRDVLRDADPEDGRGTALAWDATTRATAEPWFRDTYRLDRHQMGDASAAIDGTTYAPDEPAYEVERTLRAGAMRDPEVFRTFIDRVGMLRTMDDVLADDELVARIRTAGSGWRDEPVLGPDRDAIVALLGG